MRLIIYILLLNIFWSCYVSAIDISGCENVKDPLCCGNCASDCLQECPDAAACAAGQQDCGSIPNGNPFCPPDRICRATNCDCPSVGNDGEPCPEVCEIECGDEDKFCDGGDDERVCRLPDFCVPRGYNNEDPPELCAGYCPVQCESDHILCPKPDDESGCEQEPDCVAKGEGCPGVCPVYCEDDHILCPGGTDADGCAEVDTCVFRGQTCNDDGCVLCDGHCPVECSATEKILCPGPLMRDGCPLSDVCNDLAKGITGAFCPDPSDSHGCPKICNDDEYLCDTFEDENGCKNEAVCEDKTVGDDGSNCPPYSVCPENCKVNELTCPGDMDENGCKNPDTCLTMTRDVNGELCPINCPGECLEDEIHCEGLTTDEGCKGPDICQAVGVKTKPLEQIGEPCPGFCPIHECPDGDIKCPAVIEPCFGCRVEEVCRVAAKDIHGAFCPLDSASHDCPTYCDDSLDEVVCPAYEDENGCKSQAVCMARNGCPEHSVCPMQCAQGEMLCPNGDDINGCKNADSCLDRGTDLDGNLCPVLCPSVCADNQNLCSGEIMANGCNGPDVCVDKVLGNGGAHCRMVCPITCADNLVIKAGGTDAFDCPVEDTCIVPMTFSDWTDDGACVPNGPYTTCGAGTQVQGRTCTDGQEETCTFATESRTVSCAEAGSELPDCQDICPFGYDMREGDVPGWGTSLGSAIALTREECAARCSQEATCLSFEHSNTDNTCNLNTVAEPTQGIYGDYAFCTKEEVTVDVKLTTFAYGIEITWSLAPGSCTSLPVQSYADNSEYTESCTLVPGEYTLTCTDSYGDGWHSGFVEIQGTQYCSDLLTGYSATHQVTITAEESTGTED